MRAVRLIGFILIGSAAILLIAAFFLPGHFQMQRSILIAAPSQKVYQLLIDLKQRHLWDPWLQIEPSASLYIEGSGLGTGSSWAWEGRKIGTANITILNTVQPKMVHCRLTFLQPSPGSADLFWYLSPSGQNTRVTWEYQMDLSWPFDRIGGLIMERYLGPQFESGLMYLKQILESES